MFSSSSDTGVNLNPMNMRELSTGEVLVIRTLRQWVLETDTNQNFRNMLSEYRTLFASEPVEALSDVLGLVREIARGTSRRIHHHTLTCPCFSADEIALVTLVASVQAHEAPLAQKLSAWLVNEDHVAAVMAAAGRVAFVFSSNAVELPLRQRGRSRGESVVPSITHAAPQTIH